MVGQGMSFIMHICLSDEVHKLYKCFNCMWWALWLCCRTYNHTCISSTQIPWYDIPGCPMEQEVPSLHLAPTTAFRVCKHHITNSGCIDYHRGHEFAERKCDETQHVSITPQWLLHQLWWSWFLFVSSSTFMHTNIYSHQSTGTTLQHLSQNLNYLVILMQVHLSGWCCAILLWSTRACYGVPWWP